MYHLHWKEAVHLRMMKDSDSHWRGPYFLWGSQQSDELNDVTQMSGSLPKLQSDLVSVVSQLESVSYGDLFELLTQLLKFSKKFSALWFSGNQFRFEMTTADQGDLSQLKHEQAVIRIYREMPCLILGTDLKLWNQVRFCVHPSLEQLKDSQFWSLFFDIPEVQWPLSTEQIVWLNKISAKSLMPQTDFVILPQGSAEELKELFKSDSSQVRFSNSQSLIGIINQKIYIQELK